MTESQDIISDIEAKISAREQQIFFESIEAKLDAREAELAKIERQVFKPNTRTAYLHQANCSDECVNEQTEDVLTGPAESR